MAQTTLIAEGATASTSAAVSIPAGATYVFMLYTSNAGGVPSSVGVDLIATAPSGTRVVHTLTGAGAPQAITGPVDIKAQRHANTQGVNVGVAYNS